MKITRIDPEYMKPGTNVFEQDIENEGMTFGDDTGDRVAVMYKQQGFDSEKRPEYIHIVDERTGERITIHFD